MVGIEIDSDGLRVFLEDKSKKVQAALKKAVRAGLAVLRKAAAAASPGKTWSKASRGYSTSVKVTSDYSVRGTVDASPPGNIIQHGSSKPHRVPMDQHVQDWLTRHPEFAAKVGPKSTALFFRDLPPRPWVSPAGEAVQDEATAAVERVLTQEIEATA